MPAVRQVRNSLLLPLYLLRHLFLDALSYQTSLILNDVVVVFMRHLHLKRVVETERIAVEGVVELVAIVHPALGNYGELEVEKLVEFALLLEVRH